MLGDHQAGVFHDIYLRKIENRQLPLQTRLLSSEAMV